MAFSNNIVTKPVTNSDISNAVNYASGDIKVLIQNGTIRWWSKAKPFQSSDDAFNEDDGVTTITRVAARKAANQGMNIGTMYSSAAAALDAAIALGDNVFAWSYIRPTSHFRYLDFDGYDASRDNYRHCPFMYRPTYTVLNDNDPLDFLGSVLQPDWAASDFASLDGWVLGMAFRLEGSRTTSYFTFDKTTDVPSSYFLTAGKYHFCVFFTNVSKSISDGAQAESFYLTPLPYTSVQRVLGTGIIFNSSGTYDVNLAGRKSVSGVNIGSTGRGRRITQVQFVFRTSASRVWSSAGTGEGDGNSYDAIDIPLDGGYAIASVIVTGTGMTSGSLYMRFVYNGRQDYLQLIPRSDIVMPQ